MTPRLHARGALAALLAGALVALPAAAAGSKGAKAAAAAAPAEAEVTTVHVKGGIYMLAGGGGANVTVQVGDDGIVIVDASVPAMSEKLYAAIRRLSDKPIRYLIDTSADADHVGGNEALSRKGVQFGGGYTKDQNFALIFSHENVLNAMSAPTGKRAAASADAWPTDTYFIDSMELYFNGEAIQMLYAPAAHSDGDSIVFFRGSDVVVAGDVFLTTTYPVIELGHGGSINGIIDALNRIVDITIPKENQEDGTLVVPGHGRVGDEYDVVVYRDMVTVIRDRVQNMIGKGMTLEQVKAAKPTSDYDGRYGATSGNWTTDKFIEAVYQTLKSPPAPAQ
jgi:glyoxylase-like metal-dependent hydrolase (beta-lactamase superfamily II)